MDSAAAPRRLVVLGTSSQVPTADRNHNGYLLRWDGEAILFDPGEGTQRELTRRGEAAAAITRICLTHFHGDHCLGLPGVVQRLALDGVTRAVPLHYPASGEEHLRRLLGASSRRRADPVEPRPVPVDGTETAAGPLRLTARPLAHAVDVLGYRLEEPAGRTLLPERLAAAGIAGPAAGELKRAGAVTVGGRRVTLEEVSRPRPGQAFALVLDTAPVPAVAELLAGADLAVVESTYLDAEADLAARHLHLTAGQAGRLAAAAGVRRLVLTHYSPRYRDESAFAAEAGAHHPDVMAARDGDVIAVPPRAGRPAA